MIYKSFTLSFDRLSDNLITSCVIRRATNHSFVPKRDYTRVQYNALWDTGATKSCITQQVVDDLQLLPTGYTTIIHADGITPDVPTYSVSIQLPNGVEIDYLTVSCAKLTGFQVLIGMDIISKGDFAITNFNGKTTFSFRIPSIEKIDFNIPKS